MNPPILILLSALIYFSLTFSEELLNWYKQTPPKNRELYDGVYVNGVFTVVGDKGFIMRSYDGENWEIISQPNDKSLLGITFGKRKFVAVGDKGRIRISDNGIYWKKFKVDYGRLLTDVAYGNSVFVAVGENGTIIYSYDGITWERAESGTEKLLLRVKYIEALGKFFVTGEDLTLLSSEDGINWERIELNLPASRHLGAIAYGKGKFVIVESGGKVLYSEDLENWNEKNVIPSGIGKGRYLLDVIFAFDRFIAVGQYGVILESKDGINWSYIRTEDSKFLMSIFRGGDFLLAVGLKGAVYKSEKIQQEINFPKIEISPKSIDFGTVLVNEQKVKTFSIRNVGEGDLVIPRIVIAGADKRNFSLGEINCPNIESNNECTIDVIFSPKEKGRKEASIRIQSNDPSNPIVSVGLIGIGAENKVPVISINKTEIIFDNLFPEERRTEKVIVKNEGYADLTINNISIDEGSFEFETNCETVKPLESCYIDVVFIPKEEGEYSGTLTIESNDRENPIKRISLRGYVKSPDEYPKVLPSNLDFGEIAVGSQIKRKIKVKNIGDEIFYSLEILLEGGVFSQTNNCNDKDLGKNDECEIEVTFSPQEEEEYSVNLNINYKVEKFVLFRGRVKVQKSVTVLISGKGKITRDETAFRDTKIYVKNGRFAQPPEGITGLKLPEGYSVFKNLAFRYAVALEKGLEKIEVKIKLPLTFNREKMRIFKCTDTSCQDITDAVSINGENISFQIEDGGVFDTDGEKNGIVEDPIVIAQLTEDTGTEGGSKSTSSGGGGCKLKPNSDIGLLVIILGFLIFRRFNLSRSR